jgi:hypothetical protein
MLDHRFWPTDQTALTTGIAVGLLSIIAAAAMGLFRTTLNVQGKVRAWNLQKLTYSTATLLAVHQDSGERSPSSSSSGARTSR